MLGIWDKRQWGLYEELYTLLFAAWDEAKRYCESLMTHAEDGRAVTYWKKARRYERMNNFPIDAEGISKVHDAKKSGLPEIEYDLDDTATVVSEAEARQREGRKDYKEADTMTDLEGSESDDSELDSVINFDTSKSRSRSASPFQIDEVLQTAEEIAEAQPEEEKAAEPEEGDRWGDHTFELGTIVPAKDESEMGPAILAAAGFLLLAYMISN